MDKAYIDVPTIGEVLNEEFLIPLGLSQRKVAEAIGVFPARINEIMTGKRAMTAETDILLCKFFGMSEGFFLRIQMDLDLLKAKREQTAALAKIIPLSDYKKKKHKLHPADELEEA